MSKNTQIVPIDLGDIIEEYKLTDSQIRVCDYLAHGISISRAAELARVKQETIDAWISSNEQFRLAITLAKQRVNSWNKQMLQQLSAIAYPAAMDIIAQDYKKADPQEKREIARMLRFIIEQSSDKGDQSVTNNLFAPTLTISDPTADAIARRMKEMDYDGSRPEIVDQYSAKDSPRAYACHPETDYGILNFNDEEQTYQCHICGKWFTQLYTHVENKHGLSRSEYNGIFAIAS